MTWKLISLLFFLLKFSFFLNAQDTLILLNGKTLVVKNASVNGYSVTYHTLNENSKMKQINTDKLFSIIHADGSERIVYLPDSLETDEYNVKEMRMYVKGEQDAIKYYKNNLNKAGAFFFGAASAYLSFYGIVGPAVYATAVGSFSPELEKQKVSDPALLNINEYREGYDRKMRDKKTKNAILYGLTGFAAGIATFSIIGNNTK